MTSTGHKDRAHARLSPSSASRWINCPASVRLTDELPPEERNQDSEFAREGTAAHELAEMTVGLFFELLKPEEYQIKHRRWLRNAKKAGYDVDEMGLHVHGYLGFIQDAMTEYPGSMLLLERKVFTGIPHSWGTADAVIVSPEHVHVIDFKYGQGVAVDAEGNPQLRLYALGAYDAFGTMLGDPEIVRMSIYQPRIGSHSTAEMTPADLLAWRDEVLPIARDAIKGSSVFGPSEAACHWCPVAGRCTVRADHIKRADFDAEPELMSDEELAVNLAKLAEIEDWCKAVKQTALTAMYQGGKTIPGYKVVQGRGRRKITDVPAAINRLVEAGYYADDVATQQMKPLGVLEKLVGKKDLPEVLGDSLTWIPGNPTVVTNDDPREPATFAGNDFEPITEDE